MHGLRSVCTGLVAGFSLVACVTAEARTAEVIAMGDRNAPAIAAGPATVDGEVRSATPDRVDGDFQLLGLQRFFAETGIAGQGAGDLSASRHPGDPFAPQERPGGPVLDHASGSRSAIVVPLWMVPRRNFVNSLPVYVPGCASEPYRPSGLLAIGAEARRQVHYDLMSQIACEQGVPVGLFDAMIMTESKYDALAVSPKLAFGLTQLMPGTAAGLGVNRFDIVDNLRGGARYLRAQLDRFGHYHLALAAYNAGPGRVKNGRVPRISETEAYVEKILTDWRSLEARATLSSAAVGLASSKQREIAVRKASLSIF